MAQAPVGTAPADEAIARSRFEQGRLAYDLGRFDEALDHFEAAYAAVPLPGFLFNLGQCHLQRGDAARAIFFYERYLELVPDAHNADVTRGLLAEARLKQQQKQQQKQQGPAAATPATAPTIDVTAPAPAAATPAEDDTVWWVAGGVATAGVAALAAGGAIAVWVLWPQDPSTSLGTVDGRQP
jgi:tetratricopeptide (TPR) repeat protein